MKFLGHQPFQALLAAQDVQKERQKKGHKSKSKNMPATQAPAPVSVPCLQEEDADAMVFLQAMAQDTLVFASGHEQCAQGKTRPQRSQQAACTAQDTIAGWEGEMLAAQLSASLPGEGACCADELQKKVSKQPLSRGQAAKEMKKSLPVPVETVQEEHTPAALEMDIFAKAMAGVTPVAAKGRDIATSAATKEADRAGHSKSFQELLDEPLDFALSYTDEYMEGHVAGIDPLLLQRLRAGSYSPEAHLDLHGQTAEQALESLTWFMKHAYQRNLRCVLLITGRGKNSPDGVGVLRFQLQHWLTQDPFKRVVMAFCSARPCDGGAGAVYTLLRKYKKTRGKIHWERPALYTT